MKVAVKYYFTPVIRASHFHPQLSDRWIFQTHNQKVDATWAWRHDDRGEATMPCLKFALRPQQSHRARVGIVRSVVPAASGWWCGRVKLSLDGPQFNLVTSVVRWRSRRHPGSD
ncbi:hypothetical protein [Bradyrhizobium sp.]|uniref:hypothetical protein n=1 Tax=Bradyrhizobium sp. TaxID=376 RepID=UPI003C18E6A7